MRHGPMFAVIAIAAAAGLAVAQTAAPRHKLHEDLPAPGDKPSRMIGGGGSGNPAAFAAGDKVLPRPPADRPGARTPDEPVLGNGGFAADRRTTMTPDGNTGPDATLHYVSVFNPDVLPFKRMSALDGVADDYTLKIAHTALVDLPVGGASDKARDPFWGSVLIHLTPGQDVPLPSVAPDMRILSYEITPKIAIKFEKDGADNFYVRSDESSAAGTYRLIFAADADAGYFAPSLPTAEHYTPLMIGAMTPAELRPVLPDGVRRQARRTLDRLGIDAEMDLGVVFNRLVGYFRAFQAKPLPGSSGNTYRDLVDNQAGVCRHRAFAFMVTANALGIPTRFVENEAHAFVEVWFPDRRWQRIDLGGAALRMEVTGASDKVLHRPRADDPFEKPPEYKQNYTQLEGDIKGLTRQQLADKHKSLNQAPPSGAFDPGPGAGAGAGAGAGSNADLGAGALADRILPDQSLPTVTRDPAKPSPELRVTLADERAFRGAELHVEGRASAGSKPLPDHAIDVFLAPAGRGGANSVLLGRAVTEANGTFRADFPIPPTITLATYEIWLSTPSDAYYNAALSE
ncbi:MAG TPA: transglutaminase domain-containing protein [Kofleriaceae bacterium]|nr:transglutaminase domain-containing protein [Kofleriaceae bacterium]